MFSLGEGVPRTDADFYAAVHSYNLQRRQDQLVHRLPCQWNFQLCSTYRWDDAPFVAQHRWASGFYGGIDYSKGLAATTTCPARPIALLHANCARMSDAVTRPFYTEAPRDALPDYFLLTAFEWRGSAALRQHADEPGTGKIQVALKYV